MMLIRYPRIIQDLPGREIQHWVEDDQLIIRIGVEHTAKEVEVLRRRIARRYRRRIGVLFPALIPGDHSTAWSGIAAATVVTITAVTLAVAHQPHQPHHDDDTVTATRPGIAADPAPPARVAEPVRQPRPHSTAAQRPATTPTVDASPSPMPSIDPAGKRPIRSTVRSAVGERPVRTAFKGQPIRRAVKDAAGPALRRPLRDLHPTPERPLPPSRPFLPRQ